MEANEAVTENTSREWEIQRRALRRYDDPQQDEWKRYALFTSGETHMDIRGALEYYRAEYDVSNQYAWRAVEVVTRVQRIVRGW